MEEYTPHEQFVLMRTENHSQHNEISQRLLIIEQTYQASKHREKVLMWIVSFLVGILLSGFTLYVTFSNNLTTVKERQIAVTNQQSKTEMAIEKLDVKITRFINHVDRREH